MIVYPDVAVQTEANTKVFSISDITLQEVKRALKDQECEGFFITLVCRNATFTGRDVNQMSEIASYVFSCGCLGLVLKEKV